MWKLKHFSPYLTCYTRFVDILKGNNFFKFPTDDNIIESCLYLLGAIVQNYINIY